MLIECMGICVLNLTLGSEAKVSAYLHVVNNYLDLFCLIQPERGSVDGLC